MKQELLIKAKKILSFREKSKANDSKELQEKRLKFLSWLFSQDQRLRVLELYQDGGEVIKSKQQIPQYIHEFKFCNTRTKINQETILEVDKLPFDKMMFLICETIASLIRKEIHFAVFYAEGQKSPHIRIYDIAKLNDMNPRKRIKAQILFWRGHVPFGLFHFVDTGIFVDEHPLQLEFSPHWKYNTPFNLLFEYPFLEVEK